SRAQPERSVNLLDRALTTYRQNAHARPSGVAEREAELRQIETARGGERVDALANLSDADLVERGDRLQAEVDAANADWRDVQGRLRRFYESQRTGEETLLKLEEDLDAQRAKEDAARTQSATSPASEEPSAARGFSGLAAGGGF